MISVGEGCEKGDGAEVEVCFFFRFANDDFFEAFAEIGESSRYSIFAFAWFVRSFDDEQAAAFVEDESGGGASRVEVEDEAAVVAFELLLFLEAYGLGAAARAVVEVSG